MEAFTLLKYWKGGGSLAPPSSSAAADTASILAAASLSDPETDDDNDADEGPFIDLEFTVPDEEADDSDEEDAHESPNDDEEEEDINGESEREFKFTLSPSSNDRGDPNLSLSPSDDLFFKGKLVLNSSEPNSKPHFTSSFLKSATKFRVFMSGLKKSKPKVSSEKNSNASDSASNNPKQSQQTEQIRKQTETRRRKLFTVKFKVEEKPIVSLFTRDNSSKGASANKNSQNQKQKTEDSVSESQTLSSGSDEKRFSKEVMQKYLKMVKPLYIRVSRRYAEKLKFSGHLNTTSPASAEAEVTETSVKGQKQGNLPLPAGLRVVCKHLGKSRSASAAAAAVSAPAAAGSSSRRDDSLLQQHDGIQSAILHCKRSFNASSTSRESESSQLPRCVSNPLHEISPELSRKSTNESKDKRL